MNQKIFVNYRRDDASADARGVYRELVSVYGADSVFMDVRNLSGGQVFDRVIADELAKSDVMLVIIGASWLTILKQRVADQSHDLLREEISEALSRGMIVIPVLIDRAPHPNNRDLPTDITALVARETEELRHKYFDRDMKTLIEVIELRRQERAQEALYASVTPVQSDAAGRAASKVSSRDAPYILSVSFLEAALGCVKRTTFPEGDTLDITIPAGTADEDILRIAGRGAIGSSVSANGDGAIQINVGKHEQFKRVGNDILLDLPIGLNEAILGAAIEIPTIFGWVVMKIPPGVSSQRVFRLKNHGVLKVGDQLVTVYIHLPDTIDVDLSYFIQEWSQSHTLDIRRIKRKNAENTN